MTSKIKKLNKVNKKLSYYSYVYLGILANKARKHFISFGIFFSGFFLGSIVATYIFVLTTSF